MATNPEKRQISDESKLFSAIAYILGTLIAIIIFFLKKDDKFTRFHAVQSILLDISVMVLGFTIMVLGFIALIALGMATMGVGFFVGFWILWLIFMVGAVCLFALRLFLAYKAYKGEMIQLPIIGKQASNIA
jgi:uncharacterized membrane protein